jgi:hypothetical protein
LASSDIFFSAVACLAFGGSPIYVVAPVVAAVLLVAPRLYPAIAPSALDSTKSTDDVFWRMGAGVLLVLLVTHSSSALGPRLSGAFAMFPVMASVLAVFAHRHSGSASAVHVLRGMVLGYYAFSIFCFVLSMALAAASIGVAFLIALGCAVLAQVISGIFLQRAQRLRAADATRRALPASAHRVL